MTDNIRDERNQRQSRVFFGWYIVAASVLTNTIFSAAYFQGFSALFLPIETHFGWNRTVLSAAMSIRQLESGLVSPFVGLSIDRIGARKILLFSAVVSGVGLIGLGFSQGTLSFFLFFIIVSFGASGSSHAVTWPVLIARWFTRKRGLATGIAVMGPIFGSPFVIANTSIEDAVGWRLVLIAYGVLVLVALTLLSLVARDRPESYGLLPDGDAIETEHAEFDLAQRRARESQKGLDIREVTRTKEFWLLTLYLGGMFVVNSAFQVHLFPYFELDKGFSPSGAAVVLTLVFTLSGIGRIGGGFLLDKVDYRIVLSLVAAIMGSGFVYLQLVDVSSVWGTVPFAALFGIGFGSIIPLRGALGSMMFGTKSIGAVVGLLQGGAVAAGVVGPLFLGVAFDLQGDYSMAMWGLVAVSAAMIPLALAMAPRSALNDRFASDLQEPNHSRD